MQSAGRQQQAAAVTATATTTTTTTTATNEAIKAVANCFFCWNDSIKNASNKYKYC